MATARNQNRDKAKGMWQQSNGTMLLKDIAAALSEPENKIRKWKCMDKWDGNGKRNVPLNKKGNVPVERQAQGKRVGAPLGNKNAVGNSGGPPKGSKNAATHNIYSTIIREELGEEEAELFDAMASVSGLEHELQIARYKLARLLREQKLRDMQGVMGGPDGADSYRLKDDFYENAILKAADVVRKMEAQLHKESIDLEKLKIEKKRLLFLETKEKVLVKPSVQPYIDALTGNMEGVWDDE